MVCFMSIAPEAPRTGFDQYSPALEQNQALAKFRAWQADEVITSTMANVGIVAPYLGSLILSGRKIHKTSYGEVKPGSTLYTQTDELMYHFSLITQADIERCELHGNLRFAVWAGNYSDPVHREVWHSDNFDHPSVRWTAAFGVGSTVGAAGNMSRSHTLKSGDIGPSVTVGKDGQLRPLLFPEGAVTRFMNSGDIHGGPYGNGARIMLQATLGLIHPHARRLIY
jgi:hypothetical protein